MALKKINFKTKEDLISHIKEHEPTFYYSSRTSTVIPYDKLETIYQDENFFLGDLSQLPSSMELNAANNLVITGPVSWTEAKQYLRSHGRNIKTAPTEDLALITSGAATSATGERCFHFGNLRSQIKSITYLDYKGEEKTLLQSEELKDNIPSLDSYKKDFTKYQDFKNAPFPCLETQTDLMIGTEGQLGVITGLEIETAEDFQVNHLFMLIPKWEQNFENHLEIANKIQNFRDKVILCEFIDANSFEYLPAADRPNQEMDALFFEVKSEFFEDFYENFLSDLSFINEELVFELSEAKFHHTRASIPRAVFEENSRMGVIKMGTDVQVSLDNFKTLLSIYKSFTQIGVKYNLFGHFGDAHLHFNFMPSADQTGQCQKQFEQMYHQVKELGGSPFAEHGIGIIKQKFITEFWTPSIFNTFKELKSIHDPHNQFFPQGFMNLKADQ